MAAALPPPPAPAPAPPPGPPAPPPPQLISRADRRAICALAAATSLHREWREALSSHNPDDAEGLRRVKTSLPLTPRMTDDCLEVLVEQLLRDRPNIKKRVVLVPTQTLVTGKMVGFAYPANFDLAPVNPLGGIFLALPDGFDDAVKGSPPKATNLIVAPITLEFTNMVFSGNLQRHLLCVAVVSALRVRRRCSFFGIYESSSHRPISPNLLSAVQAIVFQKLGISELVANAPVMSFRSVRNKAAPDSIRILNAGAIFLHSLAETCEENENSLLPDFGEFCLWYLPAITDPLDTLAYVTGKRGGTFDWWEKMVIGALMSRVLTVTRNDRNHHAALEPVNPYIAVAGTPRTTNGPDNASVASAQLVLDRARLPGAHGMSLARHADAKRCITTSRSIMETAALVRDGEYVGPQAWLDSGAISLVYDSLREDLVFAGLDQTVFIADPAEPAWLANHAAPTVPMAAAPFNFGPATANTLILTPTLGSSNWILVVVDMSPPVWTAVYYNPQGPSAVIDQTLQTHLRLLFSNHPQGAGGAMINVVGLPMAVQQTQDWICGYWVIAILRAVLQALAEGAVLSTHIPAVEQLMTAGEVNLDDAAHDAIGRITSAKLFRAGKHQPHLQLTIGGASWICPGRLLEEEAWLAAL